MKALLGILGATTMALAVWIFIGHRVEGVAGTVFAVPNPDAPPARWTPSKFPGATVLVVWRGDVSTNPVDSVGACIRAVRIKTAADGTFSVPEWRAEFSWPPIRNIRSIRYVIEPGYFSVRDRLRGRESWMTTDDGLYVARVTREHERRSIGWIENLTDNCLRKE